MGLEYDIIDVYRRGRRSFLRVRDHQQTPKSQKAGKEEKVE